MAIYMQTPSIKGNVTTKHYQDWIELKSVHFLTKNTVQTRVGLEYDRQVGSPRLSEVEITKITDSSPLLFEALLKSEAMKEVKIVMCRSGSDNRKYSEYTLHDVLISHYEEETYADADSLGQECLRLNCSKIEKKYIPYSSDGRAGSPIAAGYDSTTAQVI